MSGISSKVPSKLIERHQYTQRLYLPGCYFAQERDTQYMKEMFARTFASALLASIVLLTVFGTSALAEPPSNKKILAGYFEEWSIYYAGYNLATLESNGSVKELSH